MTSPTIDRRLGLRGDVGYKAPVRAATTANITLSGEQTIDGVAVVSGDRVLVKNQTTSSQNGVYDVSTAAWTRSLDGNGAYDLVKGSTFYVTDGGQVNQYFRITSNNPITPGTTALTFSSALPLVTDLSASTGSSLVGFLQAGVGAVGRTAQSKMREIVSITDFAANGVSGAAVDPTGALDSTLGIQAVLNICASATQYDGKTMFIPAGRYKNTAGLSIPQQFIRIRGEGRWSSQLLFTGVAASALTTAAMTYLRPVFEDFAIVGNAASGKGIDFSNISGQVYLGSLRNLYIESGGNGLHSVSATGSNFFSMMVDNVASYSYNGHCFNVACGPAVGWHNCYALTAGSGKAGYRLAGIITMYSCNGVNSADYWGVFGNDLASADGFQTDFPHADLPDISLIGCNVEEFGSQTVNGVGIQVQNNYQRFDFIGGKFDRNNLATAYKAIVRCRLGPNGGSRPVRLSPGALYLGGGTPSLAHLYADAGAVFEDERGIFIASSVTTYKVAALTYPLLTTGAINDVFQDVAYRQNAINPRRITCEVMRFKELTVTTVNPNPDQPATDVTGYTKLIMSPASASIFSRFSFTETTGIGSDYLRNGDLILEATNGNTTLHHNYAAANGIRLKGGANKVMAQGEIVRLMRSANYTAGVAGWVEV